MGTGDVVPVEQADPVESHHMHHAGSTQAPVAANAGSVGHGSTQHHPSDAPPCDMAGHCTATLPGMKTLVAGFTPVVHAESASRPGWQLHLAPPSHLTPPPKA
jgi:hypothetical protein